jgi:shikimate kinase
MTEADPRRQAVALVGFMGAGKSAVGERLAAALALPFVDTDELIEATAGPIPMIFADGGEQGFRALEAQVVTAAIAAAEERPCVLALGGGAVLSAEVRAALERLAHVAWLDAPVQVLWARVTAAGTQERPLAGDEPAFSTLLKAREPLYREVATRVIETGDRSAAAIAAELAADLLAAPTDEGGAGVASPAGESRRS